MDQRIPTHLVFLFVVLFVLPALAGLLGQEQNAADVARGSNTVGAESSGAVRSTCFLSILILDYTEIDPMDWDEAKQRVAAIFRRAGIEVEWRLFFHNTDTPSLQNPDTNARCALRLNLILPARKGYWAMRKSFRLPKTALGFALTRTDAGTHGDTVYVFVNRVEEVVRRERFGRLGAILGTIIAHELGHLLLGRGHSPNGLMSAEVGELTARLAGGNALHFTGQQAMRLRAAIEERASER